MRRRRRRRRSRRENNRIMVAVVEVEYNRIVVVEAYINLYHTHFVVVAILVYSFHMSAYMNYFCIHY